MIKLLRWERRLRGLEKITLDLRVKRRNTDANIRERIEDLTKLRQQVNKEIDNAMLALENANILNKKIEAALETANEQIQHYEEVIVPALVAGNQVVLDRWQAESAILMMRKGAAEAPREAEA